ncbi:MAG: hypothetical protein HKM93_14585 [Desulfobacteraceae bacterium]|nr:hypothetical protein [Desulfobacteraceae bacterium]
MALINDLKNGPACFYFDGSGGCDYCDTMSDYVDIPGYKAHNFCNCNTEEADAQTTPEPSGNPDTDPDADDDAVVVYKNLQSNAEDFTESREGDEVFNGSRHTVEVTLDVNETFTGEHSVNEDIEAAFDLSGYTYEENVTESFDLTLDNNEGAVARAVCWFETIQLSVDVYWKFKDGDEIFMYTAEDEITHIRDTHAEIQDR